MGPAGRLTLVAVVVVSPPAGAVGSSRVLLNLIFKTSYNHHSEEERSALD
jgi:hypothetical protein